MEISIREIFEGSINIIFAVLMWWVTISILRRYRETRYLPALLMGSGFFVLGFIFAPILGVMRAIMLLRPEIAGLVGPGAPTWYKILSIVSGNAFVIGPFLFGVFTRQVFRPGSTASLFFLILIGILLIGSSDLIFMFEDKPIAIAWTTRIEIRIVCVAGASLNWGWLAYESLSRWRIYRGQIEEGIKLDPVVVNRFLLWGLAGVSYFISNLMTMLFIPYEAIQPLFPTAVKQICILSFAIVSYLSWSPPAWYKNIMSKTIKTQD